MQYSNEFLEQLMEFSHRTVFAKIILLNWEELPIKTVEGQVTAGSINVDGASAVRRTCNLSMVVNDVNIQDYLWSLNTKFRLEIGLQNYINSEYPDIVWFPQGVYLITSFSSSLGASNYTISLNGKDKMCMLNGENGGLLPSDVDFGNYEEIDKDGFSHIIKNTLKDIIREAVHHYGGEPFYNIIINNLDNIGKELQEYRLSTPLYLIRQSNGTNYFQGTLDQNMKVYVNGSETSLSKLEKYDALMSNPIVSDVSTDGPTKFKLRQSDSIFYCAAKISYGQAFGYTNTEMTYTGDLIAKGGESITSVLDKIKNMLGNYEYFYDLDGRFVFQEKQNYINSVFTPLQTTSDGKVYANYEQSKVQFNFTGNKLITTFSNAPNLANLKNDYIVWGIRKGITGNTLPIHMRYAIQKKPIAYKSITVLDAELADYNKKYNLLVTGQTSKVYTSQDNESRWLYNEDEKQLVIPYAVTVTNTIGKISKTVANEEEGILVFSDIAFEDINVVDWREIIYRMAADYFKYGHLDDFGLRVSAANPDLFPNGVTGFEQYYIDIQGYWRDLYNPELKYSKVSLPDENKIGDYFIYFEQYYKFASIQDIPTSGAQVYILNDGKYEKTVYPYDASKRYYYKESWYEPAAAYFSGTTYYQRQDEYYPKTHKNKYWNKKVFEEPESLNFWLDFLDNDSELSKYSVDAIGVRQKLTNDNSVKSIYYRDTPNVILYQAGSSSSSSVGTGESVLQVPLNYKGMFSQSAQGKSAKDAIDNLLYNHAYCTESVTISSIPIYYLEPNKRIYVYDDKSGIEGDYLVSKITVPLTHNGTMSITATKVVDRIL